MGLKTLYVKLVFFLMIALSAVTTRKCSNADYGVAVIPPDNISATASFDLAGIFKRKKLVALTENSSTSYFVYKGEPMGFEYDMLKAFTDQLGVELEIKIAKTWTPSFHSSIRGRQILWRLT